MHPPHRVPAALNGFGLWNILVLVLMLVAYGYPIAQFVIDPSPSAIVHRVHRSARWRQIHRGPSRSRSALAHLGNGRCFRHPAGGRFLGVIIIPVVQGRSDGIDAYTAICRALGILPGSPARQQVSDRTPPSPVSQVVWTPGVLQILADAKPERGRAKVHEVCVACHGDKGVSVGAQFPHLAGQSGAAIYKQLNDYRTGSRAHPQMTDVAKALDEPDLADVAAYYAAQPMRNPNPLTLASAPAAIVRLIELGDPAATSRPVRRAIGPVQAARLKRQFSPNRCRNTPPCSCNCMRLANGATMFTGA